MKHFIIPVVLLLLSPLHLTAQWVQMSNGIGNITVRSLAFSGNNIFAGTSGSGVYLSTNNGTNWTQTTLNNQYVYSLFVNGSYIFAGSYGIYLSTNNGTKK